MQLVDRLDAAHAVVAAGQRHLLEVIAECDRTERWRGDGCRDIAHWLSLRLGISNWTARRWVHAAEALCLLPHIGAALEQGTLCLDKVVELTRFATPDNEKRLISWARHVTVAGIRRKADAANRRTAKEVLEADRTRYLRYWWFEDGNRLGLEGSLAADQGIVVAQALDRLAGRLPDIVEHEEDEPAPREETLDERRADALVALASREIASDQDPDRATVVVQAELSALTADVGNCELEHGPVIHPETARRLCCDARLQVVVRDQRGHVVGIGRAARTVPPWLRRQLRRRDRCCLFPGCEATWFLHAHHVHHWTRGGETNLDNLALVCHFHHKLVHEHGWSMELGEPGTARWFRPSGRLLEVRSSSAEDRAPPEFLEGKADQARHAAA